MKSIPSPAFCAAMADLARAAAIQYPEGRPVLVDHAIDWHKLANRVVPVPVEHGTPDVRLIPDSLTSAISSGQLPQ